MRGEGKYIIEGFINQKINNMTTKNTIKALT